MAKILNIPTGVGSNKDLPFNVTGNGTRGEDKIGMTEGSAESVKSSTGEGGLSDTSKIHLECHNIV